MELFESSRLCSSQSGAANFSVGVEGHTVGSFRLVHETLFVASKESVVRTMKPLTIHSNAL